MDSKIRKEILELRENAQVAYIGSVNENGFPQIKGMLVIEHDSVKTHYFSTNTNSKRVGQFRNCPKASVYYVDEIQGCTFYRLYRDLYRSQNEGIFMA